MNKSLNTFSGKNALIRFLTPDNNLPTPLVEIPQELNPYKKNGVKIYAKLMNMTPLGNVKSVPALNMLIANKKNNNKIHTIIENSSGNTVFSLSVIGKLLGIPETKAFVSHEVSGGKLQLLRLLGTQPIVNEEPICPNPEDTTSGIYKAKILGKNTGWFNPGQYDNEKNPQAHYKWTGPQIWKQTQGKIDIFAAGLGTTGTMVGAGGYLKKKNKKIINIGVTRLPNNPVPGVRTPNLLGQIEFDWKTVVNECESIGTVDAFKTSVELCRHGLLVGPSSGFALAGLLQFLGKQKKDYITNLTCVFICCDSPLPYLAEYFEYLDSSYFPSIQNEHLLIKKSYTEKTAHNNSQRYTIHPNDVIDLVYNNKKESVLLDVRTQEEFEDAHPPDAVNIEHTEILNNIEKISEKLKHKTIYAICRSGRRSELIVDALRLKNCDAFNIEGGMIEWSRLNLPRVQPNGCKVKITE